MSAAVHPPTILVFDSGLGGLTVFSEIAKARPDARFVYAADDAGFPYGRLSETALVARVLDGDGAAAGPVCAPDLVVVACNTASTLVLPSLRARFAIPFVGTVPAIKPAAERSLTRHVAVLATPGTVKRDYTQELDPQLCGRLPRHAGRLHAARRPRRGASARGDGGRRRDRRGDRAVLSR